MDYTKVRSRLLRPRSNVLGGTLHTQGRMIPSESVFKQGKKGDIQRKTLTEIVNNENNPDQYFLQKIKEQFFQLYNDDSYSDFALPKNDNTQTKIEPNEMGDRLFYIFIAKAYSDGKFDNQPDLKNDIEEMIIVKMGTALRNKKPTNTNAIKEERTIFCVSLIKNKIVPKTLTFSYWETDPETHERLKQIAKTQIYEKKKTGYIIDNDKGFGNYTFVEPDAGPEPEAEPEPEAQPEPEPEAQPEPEAEAQPEPTADSNRTENNQQMLEAEIRKKNDKIKELEDKIKELEDKIKELEDTIKQQERTINQNNQKCEQEKQFIRQNFDKLHNQILRENKQHKITIETQKELNTILTKSDEALKKAHLEEIEQLQTKLANAKKDAEAAKQEVDQTIKTLEKELNEQHIELKNLNDVKTERDDLIGKLAVDRSQLSGDREARGNQIAKMAGQINNLKKIQQDLEETRKQRLAYIHKLQRMYAECEKEKDNVNNLLKEEKELHAQCEEKHEQLETEKAKCEAKNKNLKEEKDERGTLIAKMAGEIKQLKERIEQVRASRKKALTNLNDKHARLIKESEQQKKEYIQQQKNLEKTIERQTSKYTEAIHNSQTATVNYWYDKGGIKSVWQNFPETDNIAVAKKVIHDHKETHHPMLYEIEGKIRLAAPELKRVQLNNETIKAYARVLGPNKLAV